ncbi:MAG TPA: lipid II flippase MurJ [Pseudobacteroides sp.]|nr:lipid II flippase MurJ [Pseudobacteroides sp.]
MLQIKSTNKAIVFSMTLSLIAKILTLLQSQVISISFGMQRSTDILFSVLSMIMIVTSFVNTINQSVMVPSIIEVRNSRSEDESKKFISYIYVVYFIAASAIVAIMFMFPVNLFDAVLKYSTEEIKDNINIIRFIIPTFLLIIINQYVLDVFTSYRYFTLPMLLDMLKNMLIIAFVLLFKDKLSVLSLAIGVFMGNLAQFVIVNILLFVKLKCRLSMKRFKLEQKAKTNIRYVVLGQVTKIVNDYIVIYLLSGFAAGVFTAMDYGQRINTVVASVLIGQISTVIGLNFIDLYTKKKFEDLNNEFIKYFRLSLFFLLPFCFIMFLNAEYIISILFGWGKMTVDDVKVTGSFFRFFIMNLPALFVDAMIVRLIIAKQIQKISFMWSTFSSVMTLAFMFVFVNTIGYIGYPVSLLVSNIIYMLLFIAFLVRKQFEFIDIKAIFRFILQNSLFNIGITVLIWYTVKDFLVYESLLGRFMAVAVISIVYIAVYLVAGFLIKDNREIEKKIVEFIINNAKRLFKNSSARLKKEF